MLTKVQHFHLLILMKMVGELVLGFTHRRGSLGRIIAVGQNQPFQNKKITWTDCIATMTQFKYWMECMICAC